MYRDQLNLGAPVGILYLDGGEVGAGEVGLRFIERNKPRHFQREALLVVSGVDLAASDRQRAVGWSGDEADRRQRPRSAVRPDIDVNADLDVLCGWPLGVTLHGRRWLLRQSSDRGSGETD